MLVVWRAIDRFDATFDHSNPIANVGLIVVATLMSCVGSGRLANKWVHTGSFASGRKICTLIAAMNEGATHIDHVDVKTTGRVGPILGAPRRGPGSGGRGHIQP